MSHIQCINIFATADFDIKKYADFSKQESVSLQKYLINAVTYLLLII